MELRLRRRWLLTGSLAFVVIWKGWRWSLWQTLLLIAPFVVVDAVFFSANFLKLFEGAWAPLLFGATMVLLIITWRRGTGILISKTRRTEVPLDTLVPQSGEEAALYGAGHGRISDQ